MSEPITPVDPLPDGLRDRVNAGIHALIADISGTLYGAPANLREMAKVADLPPAAQRDYHLAVLAAAEMLRTQLDPVTSMAATLAGCTPDVTTTYADLGAAAGITRQAARERWPGAIPDAKPGRPRVNPLPDLPLPDGVVVTGQVHRAWGRPYTDIGVPADLQVGDWAYIGEGSLGKTPREVTGTEDGGGGNWEITTSDGDRTRVRAMTDLMFIRPTPQVTVYLNGGPSYWDGEKLEFDRDSVYGHPLDDVGGLLMIPDGNFPDHLEAGVDWRAHYAPEAEATRTVWTFQGWVPS